MEIVMCSPEYFDVTYELSTNRWMNRNVRPDRVLARRQWEKLFKSYERLGVDVDVVPGQPGLSDMVFTANAGIPVNNYFIFSRFFHKERRPEIPFIRDFLGWVFDKKYLPNDVTFEGQGDALFINDKTLMVGCGIRTSKNTPEKLQEIISQIRPDVNVVPLFFRPLEEYPLGERVFYHLDTCFLYLKKAETFFVHQPSFTAETLKNLRKFGDIIGVTREEADSFICNSVEVGDVLLTPNFMSCYLTGLFKNFGYEVIQHDMSEFMKSGGAVKCLSLEI